MIPVEKVGDGVFVSRQPIVCIGDEELDFIKREASRSGKRRARICAHRSNADALHEMVIAIVADSYIQPHRHIGKSESFHIIEGIVDVVIFDDDGAISEVIELGAPGSGRLFFYRLSESRFHTLLIRSPLLVMHEVTNGPFNPEQTIVAPFAPPGNDEVAGAAYMTRIQQEAGSFCGRGEV